MSPIDDDFIGTWHIVDMEMWNPDYFNMEMQAYLYIDDEGLGNFQFGLVSGGLDGYMDASGDCVRFTWEGHDEMEPMSGSGRLDRPDGDTATGMIKLHLGDHSAFRVVKASEET